MRAAIVVSLILGLVMPVLAVDQPVSRAMVEVRLIEIDAVVADRQGNAVHGLGPDDFELFENGKPQTISNFAEYSEISQQPERGVRPQPRNIVLLLDALPIRGAERTRLFEGLHKLVETTVRDIDRAQLLAWHDRQGLRTLTPLTSSRAAVLAALTRLEQTVRADDHGPRLADDLRDLLEQPDVPELEESIESLRRFAAEEELAMMRRKTAAIQRIVGSLAAPEGRNALVYVSQSFPLVAGGASSTPSADPALFTTAMLEAIARTANARGVVIYAIRPEVSSRDTQGDIMRRRAPPAPSAAVAEHVALQNQVAALSLISHDTGGTVAIGATAVERVTDRLLRDLSSYYTLAYHARTDGTDRERHVTVRAKNRQHVVHARRTIVDRSDRTRARDLLVARLFERGADGELEFSVTAKPARHTRRNRTMIPVEIAIPADQLRFEEEGGELVARYSILAVAGTNIGQVTRVQEDSKRVALPRGASLDTTIVYETEILADLERTSVSLAVFDEASGLAGTYSMILEGGEAQLDEPAVDSAEVAAWRAALRETRSHRKPIVVYFRPARCSDCDRFERDSLAHPTVERRLPGTHLLRLQTGPAEVTRQWESRGPGIAIFDRLGTLRFRWKGLPPTAILAAILDGAIAVAPHLERAAALAEEVGPHDGEVEAGIAMAKLGRLEEGRKAIAQAIAEGAPATKQRGRIALARIDAGQGRSSEALAALHEVIAEAITPDLAGEAWLTIGAVHRGRGENEEALHAFTTGRELLGPWSPHLAGAEAAIDSAQAALRDTGPIRIVPPQQQVVSGRQSVPTTVSSAEVATVSFILDGKEAARITRPPFAARLDFGRIPEQRSVAVIAYDAAGKEIGRDAITINEGGERFWLRLIEPREGPATGTTRVAIALRAPAAQKVERVTVSWNESPRGVLQGPPWETAVNIPAATGVLRAVAQLSDGRFAEDAVLLNAVGGVEHADVHLVELPVTVTGRGSEPIRFATRDFVVRERGRTRAVEAISTAEDAPLTVGLVIDASASMLNALPDVQEAAIRFLDRILTDTDRAFVIAFDSRARLIQPPTSDKALLRQKIMTIRANGLTALHDAMAVGLLQFAGVKGRRALVLFSDGADRTSRYTPADVGELARRTHVPIHVIAARPPAQVMLGPKVGQLAEWNAAYLQMLRMTKASGGSAHTLDRLDALQETYDTIAAALHAQLLIAVRTEPATRENEWREIDVSVARGRLTVHAPEGYYAPW